MKTIGIFLLTIFALFGCNSTPQSTQEIPIEETTEISNEPSAENIEPEYQLPTERVVVYSQYSLEELWNNSTGKPSFTDTDLTPAVISFPRYPRRAFDNGAEGDVTAVFTAPAYNSTIKQINILSSKPDDSFGKSALKAMSTWRFSPLTIKREKYTVKDITILMQYRIEAGKPVIYFKEIDGTQGKYPPGAISIEVE